MDQLYYQMGLELTKIAAAPTISIISEKLKISKSKKNNEETISLLEEQLNQMLQERTEIIRIALAYKEYYDNANLTEESMEYISRSVNALFELFNKDMTEEQVEILRGLINSDTIKIMQPEVRIRV